MSVSRKSTCDQCDQLYKYQYHLKLKSLEPEPFYFVYGKIVHKIAEEYVAQRGDRQLYEIVSDVLGGKIPIERGESDVFAPSIPPEYKKRMPEHLESIKKITEKIGFDGHLEYPFYEDLDAPNKKHVKGFIDRLYQKGDLWYIIDYKTTKPGKYRKNNQTIVHDLQLRTYSWIVQKHFNVPAENIRAALYYLEGANIVGAKFTQAAIDRAPMELLETYNRISQLEPDRVLGNVDEHCRRCNFRKICPFFNAI